MTVQADEREDSPFTNKSALSRLANDVDQYVGLRIRERRQQRGVTQQELARALGISYQQVQKYENGTNRVSAGRLYILAQALDLGISDFFDGFGTSESQASIAVTSEDVVIAAKELNAVKDLRVRNSIRALVRILGSQVGGSA